MAQNLKIYVSQQSFDDEDEYEIVSSNIGPAQCFVERIFE